MFFFLFLYKNPDEKTHHLITPANLFCIGLEQKLALTAIINGAFSRVYPDLLLYFWVGTGVAEGD
jgi:hypothetical protein